MAALEHYPAEGKIFLLDLFDRIGAATAGATGDAENATASDPALLNLIRELGPGVAKLGVDVPLTLPPCIECTRVSCPLPVKCTVPAVKWMRETARRAHRRVRRPLELTPYTQRPIELLARHVLVPALPEYAHFDIDEALGGTKAPLTARMHMLQRHLTGIELVEVWPKLTVARLAVRLKIPKRTLETYRSLELGAASREAILEALSDDANLFIYERDLRKLAVSLGTFDAFICAYTALLSDAKGCSKIGTGFPTSSGWVQFPL